MLPRLECSGPSQAWPHYGSAWEFGPAPFLTWASSPLLRQPSGSPLPGGVHMPNSVQTPDRPVHHSPELLGSPPASASQAGGTTGTRHHARQWFLFIFNIFHFNYSGWSSLGWFCLRLSVILGHRHLFPFRVREVFNYYYIRYALCSFLPLSLLLPAHL